MLELIPEVKLEDNQIYLESAIDNRSDKWYGVYYTNGGKSFIIQDADASLWKVISLRFPTNGIQQVGSSDRNLIRLCKHLINDKDCRVYVFSTYEELIHWLDK